MNTESLRVQVLLTLAGVAGGILVGMLFGRCEGSYETVELGTSVPLALLGGLAGFFLGLGANAFSIWKPRTRLFIDAGSIVILFVGIGAMTGWVVVMSISSLSEPNSFSFEQQTRCGMAVGALAGLLLGVSLGASRVLLKRKQAWPSKEADSDSSSPG